MPRRRPSGIYYVFVGEPRSHSGLRHPTYDTVFRALALGAPGWCSLCVLPVKNAQEPTRKALLDQHRAAQCWSMAKRVHESLRVRGNYVLRPLRGWAAWGRRIDKTLALVVGTNFCILRAQSATALMQQSQILSS